MAFTILLFLPLTFNPNNSNNSNSNSNTALAQPEYLTPSYAYEQQRRAYESHLKYYTECINTQPPPGITINCGPPPQPPTPFQPLDCEQLDTCSSQSAPTEPLCPPSSSLAAVAAEAAPSPSPSPSPSEGINWGKLGLKLGILIGEIFEAVKHRFTFGPLPALFPSDLINNPRCLPTEG